MQLCTCSAPPVFCYMPASSLISRLTSYKRWTEPKNYSSSWVWCRRVSADHQAINPRFLFDAKEELLLLFFGLNLARKVAKHTPSAPFLDKFSARFLFGIKEELLVLFFAVLDLVEAVVIVPICHQRRTGDFFATAPDSEGQKNHKIREEL